MWHHKGDRPLSQALACNRWLRLLTLSHFGPISNKAIISATGITKTKDPKSIKDVGAFKSKPELKKNKRSCLLTCIHAWISMLVDANILSPGLTRWPLGINSQQQENTLAVSRQDKYESTSSYQQRDPLSSSNRQMQFQLLHYALKCWPRPPCGILIAKSSQKSSLFILIPLLHMGKLTRTKSAIMGANVGRKLQERNSRFSGFLDPLTGHSGRGQTTGNSVLLSIRLFVMALLHVYLARPSSTSRTGKLHWLQTASPHRPRWRQTHGTHTNDRCSGCPPKERC